MQPQTYFGHIERIRHDPELVKQEKLRLDVGIESLAQNVRSRLTAETAPSLIWALALKEIGQVSEAAHHLTEHRVTDFAGQARYLRGVAASVAFDEFEINADPQLDKLVEDCSELWLLIGHREMINNLGISDREVFRKRHAAAAMSLLSAFQLEITYVEQAERRFTSLFSPFSKEVVEPQLHLSVEEIANGIRGIRQLVFQRLRTAQQLMEPLFIEWEKYKDLYDSGASGEELDAFLDSGKTKPTVGASFFKGHEAVAQVLIFSPSDVACLPEEKAKQLLEEFSFVPGEANRDFITPFDADAVRARPFAKFSIGTYLLVDFYYSAFAPCYRLLEQFTSEKLKQRLNRRRDILLEEDAASLLGAVVQAELSLTNYFAPLGPNGELVERDLLLVRDGVAIVAESKAKPLRDIGDHRGNVCKIESDVKNAIQTGYEQACSSAKYVTQTERDIHFFDSAGASRKQIATLAGGQIVEAFPIVVTDSYYGLIATDLGPWLKVDSTIGFPWVVDRDTMESIFTVLNSSSQLIEFLRWRRSLHGKVLNEDEAVFAGFFLRHGAAEIPAESDIVHLDQSYADVFEAEYYRRQGIEVNTEIPAEITPPIWASLTREGNQVTYRIDGRFHDSIDLMSGRDHRESTEGPLRGMHFNQGVVGRDDQPPSLRKIGRNELCPCGSGRKFKRCCINLHG